MGTQRKRIMKLKFWERHKTPRRPETAIAERSIPPAPFERLSRDESLVILLEASLWLREQFNATALMADGPSKRRRESELMARDRSLERDFQALRG